MKASHARYGRASAIAAIAVVLILALGCGGSASSGSSGGVTGSSSGTKSSAEKGQAVFQSGKMGCSTCHKVNGQGGAVGPDLSKVGTTAAQRKSGVSAEDYLKESIKNPGAFVVEGFGNMMPKTSPTEQELDDLVAYLMSLK